MRLTLLPNLRLLWRGPHSLQLGVDPDRALVLTFSAPGAARILKLLDGSRTVDEVLEQAQASFGLAPADTSALLSALIAAGLAIDTCSLLPEGLPDNARRRLLPEATALAIRDPTGSWSRQLSPADLRALTAFPEPLSGRFGPQSNPAEVIRRRAAAKAFVTGSELLVTPIAIALAGSGLGQVDLTVDGRGRPAEVIETLASVAPQTRVAPLRAGTATVVVRVGIRPAITRGGVGRSSAVLQVAIREGLVVVGPLVRPGGSPCANCLELHRADRDPAWPVLAAQLAQGRPGTEICALTTALAAAAYAAEEVLSYIDLRPVRTEGAAVEINRPGEMRRRVWGVHPKCGCQRISPSG
jgi:hypothetical protein